MLIPIEYWYEYQMLNIYLGNLDSVWSNLIFLKPDLTPLELLATYAPQVSIYIHLQNLGNAFVCIRPSMDPTLYLALWPCWNLSSYRSRSNELWGIRAGRGLEVPNNSTTGKATKISSGKISPPPQTRKRCCSYWQGRLSKILGNQGPQLLKSSHHNFQCPIPS